MAKKPKGIILNRADLATAHGVSMPTIDSWVRAGCPCEQIGGKGSPYQFNSADVINWRIERERRSRSKGSLDDGSETLDNAQRRSARAKADLDEIKLAEKRGEVVPIRHVVQEFGRLLSNLRARILAVPVKLAPSVHAAETVEDKRSAIETALRDALSESVSALEKYNTKNADE